MKKGRRMVKRIVSWLLAITLVCTSVPISANAAKKVKLNKTSVKLKVDKSVKLKLKNNKNKVKWSSANRKIATVNKSGLVKAKKKGKTRIIAKVKKKKYICKITVEAKNTNPSGDSDPENPETGDESGSSSGGDPTDPSATETPFSDPAKDPEKTPHPQLTPDPWTTQTPWQTPDPSASPDPWTTPEPWTTPNPSATPDPWTSSNPSASPDPWTTPAPWTTPNPSATPNPWTTPQPTTIPTSVPTAKPTAVPTAKPTATPTLKPTAVPTAKPTATPTLKPTAVPTAKPTATPTLKPTAVPTAKPTATPTLKPTAVPTSVPTATPTLKPTSVPTATPTSAPTSVPTATPSGSDLPTGATVFTMGTKKLAIGMTEAAVRTVLDSVTETKEIRDTGKSPQDFDVIAYNTKDYKEYLLIYLKDTKVVGICGISTDMSYGDAVAGAYGTALSSEWKNASDYMTRDGQTKKNVAARSKKISASECAYAFYDAWGSNQIYCIQVFDPTKITKADDDMIFSKSGNLTYNDVVNASIATETGKMLNAFRAYYGKTVFGLNTKVANCAQAWCNQAAQNGVSTISSRGENDMWDALDAYNISAGNYGEACYSGAADAISFANSIIEMKDIREDLVGSSASTYRYAGVGMAGTTKNSHMSFIYVDTITW